MASTFLFRLNYDSTLKKGMPIFKIVYSVNYHLKSCIRKANSPDLIVFYRTKRFFGEQFGTRDAKKNE